MSEFHRFIKDHAERKKSRVEEDDMRKPLRRARKAEPANGLILSARTLASKQITTRLQEARKRVEAALAKPGLSAESLRTKARSVDQWEQAHGKISVMAGSRR
ncbi:Uncharacterised protein [Bordetella ansorpii]|uniref:Uncharacterized protein n=1 Tax=Bordetella ansorpii TaxID=288768 RepID=A0A157PJ83_9BORD|nr:hypothetical protein [Bordetella ansorpii]SAI33414.1 Uncharacterised protein [Bordetella ansorpii]